VLIQPPQKSKPFVPNISSETQHKSYTTLSSLQDQWTNPCWPTLLTKILVHAFGYDGVNNVIAMEQQAVDNYGMLAVDAITPTDGDKNSLVQSLAIRLKQVWASSKGSTILTADKICYYNDMAEDFASLETNTYLPKTAIGKKWNSRGTSLAQTPQVRSRFLIGHVFAYLNPRSLTAEESDREFSKLRKERIMARNVASRIKVLGVGICAVDWQVCLEGSVSYLAYSQVVAKLLTYHSTDLLSMQQHPQSRS
jgi:hypothetical protein